MIKAIKLKSKTKLMNQELNCRFLIFLQASSLASQTYQTSERMIQMILMKWIFSS